VKRKLIFFLMLIFLIVMYGCQSAPSKTEENAGLSIVATLFPQYDFARAVLGDNGMVTMLLSPGMESHTYEPTPADMIAINKCDLFLYSGEEMEAWAHELLDGLDCTDAMVCETSARIELAMTGHSHEEHDDHKSTHSYVYDPHIWTSPVNAITMVETIRDAIVAIDPANEAEYTANAQAYIDELLELDAEFRTEAENGVRNKLVFAGRFALHYFVTEYGLDYVAAYDSCSSETEPSAAAIKTIVDTVKNELIPVVYCEELVDQKVANSIAEETGTEVLVFHSCHNVSKADFDAGETYVSLMRKNLVNLKKGLN